MDKLLDAGIWRGRIFAGEWAAGDAGTESVIDEATGEVLRSIGIATPAQIKSSAQTARSCRPGAHSIKRALIPGDLVIRYLKLVGCKSGGCDPLLRNGLEHIRAGPPRLCGISSSLLTPATP